MNLSEEFKHKERSIVYMYYYQPKDLIVISGAKGISAWRLHRNSSLDTNHIIHKLFTFIGCDEWISKCKVSSSSTDCDKVYAISNRSAFVLSLEDKRVVASLIDIHDVPITDMLWLDSNYMYLTGCSLGVIKAWTTTTQSASSSYSFYRSFNLHTKAITSLVSHPSPGFFISSSIDGLVVVYNIDTLSIISRVELNTSVTSLDFYISSYQPSDKHSPYEMVAMVGTATGQIKLWKVTNCSRLFSFSYTNNSTITSVSLMSNRIYTLTSVEMRVYDTLGNLLCLIDSTYVCKGILNYGINDKANTVLFLLDNNKIDIFDLVNCKVLSSFYLRELNRITSLSVHSSDNSLYIGEDNGEIAIITLINYQVIDVIEPLARGLISQIKVNESINQLIVLFEDSLSASVVIWDIISKRILFSVGDINAYTSHGITNRHDYLAIGLANGTVRLFQLISPLSTNNNQLSIDYNDENYRPLDIKTYGNVVEIAGSTVVSTRTFPLHRDAVTSIACHDELRIVASSSLDHRIILRTFANVFVRVITLYHSSLFIVFSGSDIIASQEDRLVVISRDKWDSQGNLQTAIDIEEIDRKECQRHKHMYHIAPVVYEERTETEDAVTSDVFITVTSLPDSNLPDDLKLPAESNDNEKVDEVINESFVYGIKPAIRPSISIDNIELLPVKPPSDVKLSRMSVRAQLTLLNCKPITSSSYNEINNQLMSIVAPAVVNQEYKNYLLHKQNKRNIQNKLLESVYSRTNRLIDSQYTESYIKSKALKRLERLVSNNNIT